MAGRFRPRGRPRAVELSELHIRRTIRTYLRSNYPDVERPTGKGWLFAPIPSECPECGSVLLGVYVPNVAISPFAYCLECNLPMTVVDSRAELLP